MNPNAASLVHAEAYCLMTYRSDDGSESEVVWNSRDGVTPFVITLRSGKQATHVDWHLDRRVSDHVPAPGSRMFVDCPEALFHAQALRRAQGWFRDPDFRDSVTQRWGTPEAMAEALHKEWQPGLPHLVEVPA